MVDIVGGVFVHDVDGDVFYLTQVLPLAGGPSTLLAGSHSSYRPHCKIHFNALNILSFWLTLHS